jgi:hypothetical protein
MCVKNDGCQPKTSFETYGNLSREITPICPIPKPLSPLAQGPNIKVSSTVIKGLFIEKMREGHESKK